MKKNKFYISDESKLNNYEKENKRISYKRLIDYLFSNMIICNKLPEVMAESGEYLDDCIECGKCYDEKNDEYVEIYQYFLVNLNSSSYDFIQKYCNNEIILFYSEKLDLYVLGVDHLGTSWDYVLTDFEYTTDYDQSMQGQLYKD